MGRSNINTPYYCYCYYYYYYYYYVLLCGDFLHLMVIKAPDIANLILWKGRSSEDGVRLPTWRVSLKTPRTRILLTLWTVYLYVPVLVRVLVTL